MTDPAPLGWALSSLLDGRHLEIARLREATRGEIRHIEATADSQEARGIDSSCLRQILRELRWRLEYTADIGAIHRTLERARAAAGAPSRPTAAMPGNGGSYGPCTDVWFLKLDASADHLLSPDFDDRGRPPHFLDRINDPGRLKNYLEGLLVSRPHDDGIDRRKELNFVTAALVRLILWRRPRNYQWHPELETVIRRFIVEWQDPMTGFFGAGYLVGGRRFQTVDLSLTFHMARYLEGKIGYWPQLIDTLLGIRDKPYPNGWLNETGMTSHNNYDVAVLFQLGWPHMSAEQRQKGSQELARLLDWCLTASLTCDGKIVVRANGESLPEGYYFTIAFLDTVGLFDPAKRFWTDRELAEAPAIRAALENRLSLLPQSDPMVRMAQERLSRSGTPKSGLE